MQDLRAVNNDLHLRVVPNEIANASTGGRRMVRRGSAEGVQPGTNQFVEASLLEGNVGYVEVKMIRPPNEDFRKALEEVADAEALIFDI